MPRSNGTPIPRCPEFNSTYHKKCRCSFCREEHRKRRNAQRLRAMERARGIPAMTDRVDPTETVELVRRANANGASDDELSALTGIASSTFYTLRNEEVNYVIRSTAFTVAKALRGNEDARAFSAGTKVNVKWTKTMVHALMAQGWPAHRQQQILHENLGISGRFIFTAIRELHDYIYYSNEQAMRWLVSEIGDTRGPSNRSMKFAERHGYFPTKHYDVEGNLVVKSLPKELRQSIEGV